jgi:hypothetical protein
MRPAKLFWMSSRRSDMRLQMEIEQTDNGWILRFTGHNCLDVIKIYSEWEDVLKELDEYFGWANLDGKWFKKNPYC